MPAKRELLGPLILVVLGVAWQLNVLKILPGVDWIWVGGLALGGVVMLLGCGWNRLTAIFGPFLLIASILSVLRQTGRLEFDHEVPILVIVLGLLWLAVTLLRVPMPKSLAPSDPPPPET